MFKYLKSIRNSATPSKENLLRNHFILSIQEMSSNWDTCKNDLLLKFDIAISEAIDLNDIKSDEMDYYAKLLLFNITFSMVSSGQYHMYAGVL
jgi:hypothetical protein